MVGQRYSDDRAEPSHAMPANDDDDDDQAKPIDLRGKRLAFFGGFSYWPSYHDGSPADIAQRRGARLSEEIVDGVDYVVLGDMRGSGRGEAKKKLEKLQKSAAAAAKKGLSSYCPEVIDERTFRELVRIDLTGKSFAFTGGFDCLGGEIDNGMLGKMVGAVGGQVTNNIDEKLDYLVVGNRRGEGKITTVNLAKKLLEKGARLSLLPEENFLDLVRTDQQISNETNSMDFSTLLSQLYGTVDQGKLGRAMKMLKSESFKLYVHKDEKHIVGVVRSQTADSKVYSSWLNEEGKYGCATQDLSQCMGLQGTVCKHLLVLMIGLVRSEELTANLAYEWLKMSKGKGPRSDSDLTAQTFIQFKGAEAGEIDWRPTETIPEDYYAF